MVNNMRKDNHLVYEHGTRTIRQKPGNYMIARLNGSDGWICDPDLAADHKLCMAVFEELLTYSNKYGTGENLIQVVEMELKNTRSVAVSDRSVVIEYARTCECYECADEVARTLDEIAEVGGPLCPRCGHNFMHTSVEVITEK